VGVAGIIYTSVKPVLPGWAKHRILSTSIFLIMGWVLIVRLTEILGSLGWTSSVLLVCGGLSYSIGAVIYAFERPKLYEGTFGYHELWHLMVMFGFLFHYFVIFRFYTPYLG